MEELSIQRLSHRLVCALGLSGTDTSDPYVSIPGREGRIVVAA
jgi:hypothetical protein